MEKTRVLVALVFGVLVVALTAATAMAAGQFSDDDGNTHEGNIEAIAAEGITKGCNPPANDLYCPDATVTRGQMAAFVVRAMGYTDDGGGDLFTDDDGSTFESDIDKLATAGVTLGCNPPANTRYCPNDFVTRGQMAAFLVRAMGYTDDGGGDLFTDDDGSTFESDIDKLGTAGVTLGCNPPVNDEFCPDDPVLRDQMASFLARALGLAPVKPSADLDLIIYQHGEVEAAGLATIKADGSALTFLDTGQGLKACPQWSPDRTQIAYGRVFTQGASIVGADIAISDPNGQNTRVLVEARGCPSWSPDGTRIVYDNDDTDQIWIVDVDGSNGLLVTEISGQPAWSPDGDRLAILGDSGLMIIPVPGSGGGVNIVASGGVHPDWRPDGSKLAFAMDVNGVRQVFVANPDGSGLTQLTSEGFLTGGDEPAWSPDGQRIVFSSDRSGSTDLYVMDADGSNVTRLTNTSELEFPNSPDW